jgi:hypothetical protein
MAKFAFGFGYVGTGVVDQHDGWRETKLVLSVFCPQSPDSILSGNIQLCPTSLQATIAFAQSPSSVNLVNNTWHVQPQMLSHSWTDDFTFSCSCITIACLLTIFSLSHVLLNPLSLRHCHAFPHPLAQPIHQIVNWWTSHAGIDWGRMLDLWGLVSGLVGYIFLLFRARFTLPGPRSGCRVLLHTAQISNVCHGLLLGMYGSLSNIACHRYLLYSPYSPTPFHISATICGPW